MGHRKSAQPFPQPLLVNPVCLLAARDITSLPQSPLRSQKFFTISPAFPPIPKCHMSKGEPILLSQTVFPNPWIFVLCPSNRSVSTLLASHLALSLITRDVETLRHPAQRRTACRRRSTRRIFFNSKLDGVWITRMWGYLEGPGVSRRRVGKYLRRYPRSSVARESAWLAA